METARTAPSRGIAATPRRTAQVRETKVAYRRCPQCDQAMHRKNFGRRSGVILDWCGDHGTWLDAKELEQVAQFVLSGALAESERQRLEEAATQQRPQVEDMDAWMLAQSAMAGEPLPPGRSHLAPVVTYEMGASLGSFLRGLLGK